MLFTRADIEIRLFYPIDLERICLGEPFRYYGPPIRLGWIQHVYRRPSVAGRLSRISLDKTVTIKHLHHAASE